MTSRKTSFFLYLMPSDLQETALVTVAGGRGAPVSSLWPSCVMYLWKIKTFHQFTPEWHLLGQRKAWKYFSAASFETKQCNDLKTFKWMSVVWFEGEWAETVRKRKLNTELTPGGSCCLWFAGIQSPWVHPAARRLWQSYLWCSPPPAP